MTHDDGADERWIDVPLPDLDQLNYPDVVLAETDTIADAAHDEFLHVLTCLETDLNLVPDVDDATDV